MYRRSPLLSLGHPNVGSTQTTDLRRPIYPASDRPSLLVQPSMHAGASRKLTIDGLSSGKKGPLMEATISAP